MIRCEACGADITEEGIGWDGSWWCSTACSRQEALFTMAGRDEA